MDASPAPLSAGPPEVGDFPATGKWAGHLSFDVTEVVLGPRHNLHVDGQPAPAGDPEERLVLRIEIVIIVAGVIDVDRQLARADVGRRQHVSRVVADHLVAHVGPVAEDRLEKLPARRRTIPR